MSSYTLSMRRECSGARRENKAACQARRPSPRRSVNEEFVTAHPQVFRRDEFLVRHAHGMQPPFDLLDPEAQKAVQFREFGGAVVFLPQVGLQKAGMVRQMIEDFCRGKAV